MNAVIKLTVTIRQVLILNVMEKPKSANQHPKKRMQICTDSIVGNLSLRTAISNVSSSHKNHMKGPGKRTEEDDVRFAQSFEKLILMAKSKEGAQSGTL